MKRLLLALIVVTMAIPGCNRSGKQIKGTTSDGKQASVEVGTFDPVKMKNQLVELIPQLPDSKDIVNFLNEAGATYVFDLTVPPGNIEKMLTSTQKAMGTGIFTFDGEYAAVYKRTDIVLQTRQNVDRLVTELGLQDDLTFLKKYEGRFEKNKTNPDSLDILTVQMGNEYHQHIIQGDHPDVYALASIGGNIEALYVLSQMTLMAKDKEKLLAVMNKQNERVKTVGMVLEVMSGDENVKPYYEIIRPVIQFFGEKTTIGQDDLNTVAPLIEKARNSFVLSSI